MREHPYHTEWKTINAKDQSRTDGFGPRTPGDVATGPHPDDVAVDALAARMKAKLAQKRAEGYGGWDEKEVCDQDHLSHLLRNHVVKGDPVDVANFCAFLSARGEGIAQPAQAPAPQNVGGAPTRPGLIAAAAYIDEQAAGYAEEHARIDLDTGDMEFDREAGSGGTTTPR